MKITLNKFEQELCEVLADRRHSNNRKDNVKNSKRGPQSDFETDLEGIASELAFCKIFNLYPDLSIFTRSATDETDSGDVVMHSGETVDVKTTKYKNGKLIAVPWKKPTGDYFALMVGEFPTYEFKGFMKQSELLSKNRLSDLGYGPTYVADQSELTQDIKKS